MREQLSDGHPDDTLLIWTPGHDAYLRPENGEQREYLIAKGRHLTVKEGDRVKKGQTLSEWDPYAIPLLTEVSGVVKDVVRP